MHDSAVTGLTRTAATTVSTHRHGRDQRLRDREADGARERVDVRRRARDEIARARTLDDGERQRQHLAHEVLAQPREHLLREHERGAPRKPGQRGLGDHRHDEDGDHAVDVCGRRPVIDRLHEHAEQKRPDEAGQSRERVQAEHDGEAAAVAAQQDGRVPAHLRPCGDRQPLVHAASSLVTAKRYAALDRSSSRCVPVAATRPLGDQDDAVGLVEDERAAGHDDGRAAPARLVQALRDPRLGVRVDRARRLDQNQDFGLCQQCARQDQALALTARERAAALLHVAVEPLRQRVEHILGVRDGDRGEQLLVRRPIPWVELLPEAAREEERVGLADDDAAPQLLEREFRDRHAAEGDEPVVDEAAEAVRDSGAFVGLGRDDGRQHAGLDDEAGARVREQRAGRRLRRGLPGLADERLDPQDREHPLHADVRAGDLVDRLCRNAQGDHEEGGIAVERDELARADRPLDCEPRAEPGDDDDEHAGQEHLRGVERCLGQRHPHACQADLLRAPAIPVEEDSLAADAAQHPQAGDRVGPDRRQLAHLLALLALPRLQRPDHRRQARDEDRDPEQHDQAEQGRRRQQDRRDDEVRGDRPGEPCGDVERPARAKRVVGDGRDDLARRQARPDRSTGQRRVVRDDLNHPVARLQPVADGDAVPERSRHGLNDAESEQGAGPREQCLGVPGPDPVVDRSAEDPRQQCLREHPDDPEGHPEQERVELLPSDPDQEARRRARVRRPRIAEGKLLHRRASVCGESEKSAMMDLWPSGHLSR